MAELPPKPTTTQNIQRGILLAIGIVVLCVLVMASNNESKGHLNDYCKTEGAAQYRGAVDNERAKNYIDTCR